MIYRWFRVLMGWRISRWKDDKCVGCWSDVVRCVVWIFELMSGGDFVARS